MNRSRLKSLMRRDEGSVAVMFALATVPLVLIAGSAVDYSRASQARGRLQSATDGAVLQLCKASRTATAADLKKVAQASLDAAYPDKSATADTPVVTDNPRQVTLTTRTTFEPSLAKIGGFGTFPISVTAGCEAPERFFEIALSLDTTGSMATSDGSMRKIDALKKAATDFVNYMYGTPSLADRTKVALVPFSAAVAVDPATYRSASWIDQNGQSALHWQNVTGAAAAGFKSRLDIFAKLRTVNSSWDWAGCFESLPYPANVQDGTPSAAAPDSYYVPMFAPDEAGEGGESWHQEAGSCTWRAITNSYINDASNSACNARPTPADDRTLVAQASKYKTPRGANASNDRGPNYMCQSRPLTRLTNSKSKLLEEVNRLAAAGNTNIHEGVMWGWRAVSPTSVFADGVAYSKIDTTKVIVLMTDGMNTWGDNDYNPVFGSLYSAYGYFKNADGTTPTRRLATGSTMPTTDAQARLAMDELTRQACRNAANAGVVIYTIGFSIPQDPIDQQGLKLLRDCAGSESRAFVASNATALIDVFKQIAQGIGQLRIRR